jgi:hypothetical protein
LSQRWDWRGKVFIILLAANINAVASILNKKHRDKKQEMTWN